MEKSNPSSQDETQIRALINDWAEGFRNKNVEQLVAHHTADLRLFDLAPPLEYRGIESYRRQWEEWLPTLEGNPGYEIRDLQLTVGDRVAFSTGFNQISAKKKNENEGFSLWIRVTIGFCKTDGQWQVSHEHVSVPFYMDGSFRAATDLQPS